MNWQTQSHNHMWQKNHSRWYAGHSHTADQGRSGHTAINWGQKMSVAIKSLILKLENQDQLLTEW